MNPTRTRTSRRLLGLTVSTALALGGGLAVGAVTPASAENLIPKGSLTGTVTGAGGSVLPGASITAYGDTDNDGDYMDNQTWGTATGLNGDFVLGHLPAAKFKLRVVAEGHVTEFYADAADLASATAVTIDSGNTALPPISLAAEPASVVVGANTEITGRVTDVVTGRPLADGYVSVVDPTTHDEVDWTYTDSDGRYALDDLQGMAPVKLAFSHSGNAARLGHREAWSGGARSEAEASTVTITPGVTATVDAALTPYAGITGTVMTAAGTVPYSGWVSVYDADSDYVDEVGIRADGTYYVGYLNPNEEYRLVFGGYDYTGDDFDNPEHWYFDTWYTDGNSFTTSTPVVAGAPGTWLPNVNGSLRDVLIAFEAPSVSGDFVIGKTLTGNKGRWNRNGNSTFGYEWLRGSTVVGTASTYTLTAADAGQPIALRVTNTNFDQDEPRTATATTAAQVAKYAAKVSAHAKKVKKGKKAGATQVVVTVKAAGQAAAATTGKLTVTEGKKKVATATVKAGTARFLVTKAKAGKHTYTLTYAGNGTTLAAQGTVKIKVKKKVKHQAKK